MTYYKVVKDAYDYFSKYGVIEGELLTAKERNTKCPYISDNVFIKCFTSSRNTFKMFGIRKPIDENKIVYDGI